MEIFNCIHTAPYSFPTPLHFGSPLRLRLALNRVSSWQIISNKRGEEYESAIAPPPFVHPKAIKNLKLTVEGPQHWSST